MTARIFKYPIEILSKQKIEISGLLVEPLAIRHQGSGIFLWAKIEDLSDKNETFDIHMYGTGHPIPSELSDKLVYIDTLFDGPYVWHFFIDDKFGVFK